MIRFLCCKFILFLLIATSARQDCSSVKMSKYFLRSLLHIHAPYSLLHIHYSIFIVQCIHCTMYFQSVQCAFFTWNVLMLVQITTVISLNIAMAATQIDIIKDQLINFDISDRFFHSYACSCVFELLLDLITKNADNL